MNLEKKDRNFIIESSLNKFRNYAFITFDYVNDFIDAIIKEEKSFDGIDIVLKDLKEDSNVALYVELKLKDYLYLKICRVAQEDADVLVSLIEDTTKHAMIVCKRMNVKDTNKCESYLMEAISNYDGLESFNTYLTRYLMAKIKGIPYVREEKIEKNVEEQEYVRRKYNKKPPKKIKDKKKKKHKHIENSATLNEKVETVQDTSSDDNLSFSKEEPEVDTNYSETLVITEEPIVENLDLEKTDPEDEINDLGEVVSKLNETIIDLTLFDSGYIKKITLPRTVYDEFVKEIDKTFQENVITNENATEETIIEKESKILNIQEMYAKCQALVGARKGNETKGTFLALATSVNIIEALPTSDEKFLQYLILRFSRINDSYFEIEEIMDLLNIDLKTILDYEKIVITELKTIIDKKFDSYSLYKLNKRLD